jgi:hypothetical protein
MKEPNARGDISEKDVTTALESLKSAAFTRRFPSGCGGGDPEWKVPGGQPIHEHIRERMDAFKKDVGDVRLHHHHGGVFHKFDSATLLTVGHHHLFEPVIPQPRDLFHVYGPDGGNTKDWKRYYRFAWKDKGPHAIIYSSDADIIQHGKLACYSYSYSGQSSHALAGAGLFFMPGFGDAKIIIRPYVQWLTSASFTGTDPAPASAVAMLGIYVESWAQSGGSYNLDRDHFIPVWSQNTTGYMVQTPGAGSASVGDGLSTEVLAVGHRKYAIYVYAYLETSAAPPQAKNELRYVGIDIDATVPYVVVDEKPL